MATAVRPARLVALVAAALLIGYAVLWSQVTALEIGRSDFTSTYVGATLLRTGHAAGLYDESVQSPLHAQLIAPDIEGNLPFVDAPMAAALAAPVTLLPLDAAYRVWSVLQLLILVAAVVIAIRAAPWPPGTGRDWKVAAALLAVAGAGTMVQLLQAQWGPVTALGLALAYRDWRRGNDFRGAALLVLAAAVAKPHLAVGLLAFILGWRQRRVIAGALAGGAAAAIASVAVAGPGGIVRFFTLAVESNTRWQLRSFAGFIGIPGSFLGNSGTAQVIGVAGSILALAAALGLGTLVRRNRSSLDTALAGAAVLSLLAAPHAGTHDLVMVAPVVAWSFAVALRRDAQTAAPQRPHAVALAVGLTTSLTVAAFVSLGDGGSPQLTPWVLIAAAAVAWRASVPVPSPDATALGALADGVRRQRGRASERLLPVPRRSG